MTDTPIPAAVRTKKHSRALGILWRDPSAMIGISIILLLVLLAIFAPQVAPYDPKAQSLLNALNPPSAAHWLGTDEYGRDVLSRIIFGTRPALLVGVMAVLLGMCVGIPIGIMAGFWMGWFDRVVVGNGFLPVFAEGTVVAELPDRPRVTRQLFHTNMSNAPDQQEPLYDEDGNRVTPINEDYFGIWIDYARNDERFTASRILEMQTYFPLTVEEEAAYDAPFPSRTYMGGPRAFPGLVNQLPGITQVAWEGLHAFEKPFLTIWGNNDPGNLGRPEVQQTLLDGIPGTEGWDHVRLREASHFLQDDQGADIARRVNEFIARSPIDTIPSARQ